MLKYFDHSIELESKKIIWASTRADMLTTDSTLVLTVHFKLLLYDNYWLAALCHVHFYCINHYCFIDYIDQNHLFEDCLQLLFWLCFDMIEVGQWDCTAQAEVPCPANKEDGLSRCNSHEETGSFSTVQGMITTNNTLRDHFAVA